MCCFFQTNSFHLFCHFVSPIHVGPRGERGSVGTPGEMGCLLTRISTDKRNQHASMEAEMGWMLGGGKGTKMLEPPKNWGKGMMPHWVTLSDRKWARPQKEIHLPGTSYHWFSGTIWQTVSFREGICFGDDIISFFWDSFWHAEFCRFQTLILHWSLQIPDFFCEIFRPKKLHLNGPEKPEKMILICWIAVELDDHRCIQRQILEEITSSPQLSTYLILSIHPSLPPGDTKPWRTSTKGGFWRIALTRSPPQGWWGWGRWSQLGWRYGFGGKSWVVLGWCDGEWWWMMGSTDQVAWQLPHAHPPSNNAIETAIVSAGAVAEAWAVGLCNVICGIAMCSYVYVVLRSFRKNF